MNKNLAFIFSQAIYQDGYCKKCLNNNFRLYNILSVKNDFEKYIFEKIIAFFICKNLFLI